MAYKLVDLFSGAGGMTLGFVDSRFGGGFESVWAIDNDPAAVTTFKANFGPHGICDDIENWVGASVEVPEADVVIGGPPCQGFSLLNKKRKNDMRRALWAPLYGHRGQVRCTCICPRKCRRVVEVGTNLDRFCEHACKLGFEVRYDHLLAADYGTPQTRKRAVIVGWKHKDCSPPTFPPLKTHAAPDGRTNLPRWRDRSRRDQ